MGHSVPIPTNYRDIDDHFTALLMGAPDFEILQRAVTYTITLEMMIDALLLGLEELAHRSKSDSAKLSYTRASDLIRAGYPDNSSGWKPQGQVQVKHAHNIFRSVTNKGPLWKL